MNALRRCALAGLVLAVPAIGQEPVGDPTSGPLAGTPTPALTVYAPFGVDAGLEVDVPRLFGDGPGAVLFVHELTRNVAPVVRAIDRLTDTFAPLGFESVTVLLGDDRNALERQAPAASRSIGLTRPLTVSTDGAEGPGSWALDRRAALTLVIVDDGEVQRSVRLTDTGQRDVPALREWIVEVCGALPDDPGALRDAARRALASDPETLAARAARHALLLHWRAKMDADREARQAARGRDAGGRMAPARGDRGRPAPEAGDGGTTRVATDATLRGLLRRAAAPDADAEELERVFTAIDAHVDGNDERKAQARDALRRMIDAEFGSEAARRRAQQWIDRAGGGRRDR